MLRATFSRQGKSPNQFGFSQVHALLKAGFPYVAVGHLILSDNSPEDAWREVSLLKVLDCRSGVYEYLPPIQYDMLPMDLLQRSHGRLKYNCPDSHLGYFSAYIGRTGCWLPGGSPVTFNPNTRCEVLKGVYSCYKKYHRYFLITRSYSSSPMRITVSEPLEQWERLLEKMELDFP